MSRAEAKLGILIRSLLGLTVLGGLPLYADVLTLKQAVDSAQAKHPDIRSLEHQVQSIEGKITQAVMPSEPTFQLQYNDIQKFLTPSSAASTVYQLTQPIGFPGRAWVNRSAVKAQAKTVELQLKAKRLDVANQVKSAYNQLALAKRNLLLNQEQKQSYERILAIAKRRYSSGSITQVDLVVAQTAIYSTDNDLADQIANEKTTRAQLNLLMGNEPTLELEVEPLVHNIYPPFEREKTLQKMIDNRPEIQAARSQVTAADRAQTLAWMTLLPDFQLLIGTTYYNVAGASPLSGFLNNDPAGNHTYMAGVQMVVPIWGWLNERESIVSASHDRAAAEANRDSLFVQSKVAFDTALQSLEAFRTKLTNYKEHLLPLSEQTLKLALTNYSAGKIDYQTLSDAASAWRNLRKDYYAMLVNYFTAYYAVGQLIGEDLL